jgi:hypothetical protein
VPETSGLRQDLVERRGEEIARIDHTPIVSRTCRGPSSIAP